MNFDFYQVYPEVGASWHLSHMFFNLLKSKLDSLHIDIPHLQNIFDDSSFTLVVVISASTKKTKTEVKRPIYLKKRKQVEFALHIPFQRISNFGILAPYVLNEISLGIKEILEKYKLQCDALDGCIQDVVDEIEKNPNGFSYE